MPNIKSAKKRMKTNEKKKIENKKCKGTMKTKVKKVLKSEKVDDKALAEAFKSIDKALKKGIIKKNTAARKKSFLTKNINKKK